MVILEGIFPHLFVVKLHCGQSYKHFMSVNYDPRVVIWAIF